MYSLVSRVATRPSSVRLYRTSAALSETSKANPATVWEEREKSAEDLDVKDHEKRLVEALALKLQVW